MLKPPPRFFSLGLGKHGHLAGVGRSSENTTTKPHCLRSIELDHHGSQARLMSNGTWWVAWRVSTRNL